MLLVLDSESQKTELGERAGIGDPGQGHHAVPNKPGH